MGFVTTCTQAGQPSIKDPIRTSSAPFLLLFAGIHSSLNTGRRDVQRGVQGGAYLSR